MTRLILISCFILSSLVYAKPLMNYPNALDRDSFMQMKALIEQQQASENSGLLFLQLNDIEFDTFKQSLKQLNADIQIIQQVINNHVAILYPNYIKEQLLAYINSINLQEKSIQFQLSIYEISSSTEFENNLLHTPIQEGLELQYDSQTTEANPYKDEIKLLESTGQAKLMAQPFLLVKNGYPGFLHIGDKIPYLKSIATNSSQTITLEHIQSGISMHIEPTIIGHNSIHCDIELKLLKYWKELFGNDYPALSARQYKSSINISENKSSLIASFSDNYQKENNSGLPLISKLPLISRLFNSKKTTNSHSLILIYLEATIIKTN